MVRMSFLTCCCITSTLEPSGRICGGKWSPVLARTSSPHLHHRLEHDDLLDREQQPLDLLLPLGFHRLPYRLSTKRQLTLRAFLPATCRRLSWPNVAEAKLVMASEIVRAGLSPLVPPEKSFPRTILDMNACKWK